MKDYRLLVKVKNANLLRAIEKAGFKTVNAFCVANGLHPSDVGDLINLKSSPLYKGGDWRPTAERLSVVLNTPLSVLFSEEQFTPLEKNTGHVDMSFEEILPMLPDATSSPLQKLIEVEGLAAIDTALSNLTPRQEWVIRGRFGLDGEEKTFNELAQELGVSCSMVQLIERKALSMLRKPLTANKLRDVREG